MLVLILTLLLCAQVSSFCYMNEVGGVKKQMLLRSKPTTKILVNNFINKQAKRRGISADKKGNLGIQLCLCLLNLPLKYRIIRPKLR